MTRRRRIAFRIAAIALLALAAAATVLAIRPPKGGQLAGGIRLQVAASGLDGPVVFRFAPDGRIFVGEKEGRVVVSGIGNRRPEVFVDLKREVYSVSEHGLFGLALDPSFPIRPYVYLGYTYNAPVGGKAPLWPTRAGADVCPDPPGLNENGCISSGRVSVLTARGNRMVGREHVLINDWCQQSNTHSIGDLGFGRDGALYVSAGDGAFYGFTDYGQRGVPRNPCGDPPGGVGAQLTPPTAEGGALRSQDLRTPLDPVTLDGTIIRIDPKTGAAMPGNPLYSSRDENARRIIASGLKQPFRFVVRPGTNEVWVGDVGNDQWEEINRVEPVGRAENFGWPCYEGDERQHDYGPGPDIRRFDMCRNLYEAGPDATDPPFFAYRHRHEVAAGDRCVGGSSISGLAFVENDAYEGGLARALYFADATRGCIWAIPLDDAGLPTGDPELVVRRAGIPVDLQVGPDGLLYYLDFLQGQIVRIAPAAG